MRRTRPTLPTPLPTPLPTTTLATALGLALAVLGPVTETHADPGDEEAARRRAARRTPVVEAVERAAPAVVSIGTTRLVRAGRWWDWEFLQQKEVPGALGSGVIVHPRGYVVTNAHVIHQAEAIAVKLTGLGQEQEIPADLIAFDLDNDLALLKLTDDGPYPAARFGRTDDLMVGETIIAMGSPFGLGRTVTTGVVSGTDRDIRIRDQVFEDLIQTDAAVNQGNSGGALLNILGEWIGVNSAIYSLSGGSDGISFAIPIETVRTFLVSALRPRRQSNRWAGIELRERAGGGVELGTVFAVGPGARAGLRAGSRVVAIGGQAADDPVDAAFALLDETSRGSVRLRVADAGRARDVVLPLEELPTERLAWRHLGIRCAEVDRRISEKTGYREGSGVIITEVREGSGAARTGLARGDLLLALGRSRLRSLEDLLILVQTISKGDLIDVKLLRPERVFGGVRYQTRKARLAID